ncbi:DUF4435 domain-containing protein [Pectobacterium carotovorum]|uniref:DUF4435 domain-containing protein n=1 Tax=Pectobacterium carotovorum TaxID=554 RepID=UPI003D9B5BD1
MNLVEKLRQARGNPQVSLHLFLNQIKVGEKTIHVFYEGRTDNSFYGTMIRNCIGDRDIKLKTKICDKKKNVYYIRDKLCKRSYKDNYLVFFVDKDVDDLIPVNYDMHDNVHVTEYYSIENYFVDKEMYETICSELFKIERGSEYIDILIGCFEKLEVAFFKEMQLIMGWVIACRRSGGKPLLSEINISDLFSINDELELCKNYAGRDSLIHYLMDKTDIKESIDNSVLDNVMNEINDLDHRVFVRGKYHLWLMISAINKSVDIIRKSERKIKMHVNINDSTAFDLIGPRVKTPTSISSFLERNVFKILDLPHV